MPVINSKEQEYIDLRILMGDVQQTHEDGIDVTYNLIDWLRVRNISARCAEVKDVEPTGQVMDFTKSVEIGSDSIKIIDYIEAVLVNKGVEVKGKKRKRDSIFGGRKKTNPNI